MNIKLTLIGVLCAAPVLFAMVPQKRVSQTDEEKKPITFEQRMQSANKAYAGKNFGVCEEELVEALLLTRERYVQEIMACMPPAPAGWVKVEPKVRPKQELDARLKMVQIAGLANFAPVEQSYTEEATRNTIQIRVVVNQPALAVLEMKFANEAMRAPGEEVVEYKSDKAILKSQPTSAQLQILIEGKHAVDASVRGFDGDFLLEVLDQGALDKLKGAMGV